MLRDISIFAGAAICLLAFSPASAATLSGFVEVEAKGESEPSVFGGAFLFANKNKGIIGEGVSEIRTEATSVKSTTPPACCLSASATAFGDETRRFGGTSNFTVIDFAEADRSANSEGTWLGIFSRDAATTSIDFTVSQLQYGASGYGYYNLGARMRVLVNPIGPSPEFLGYHQQVAHEMVLSPIPATSAVEPLFFDMDIPGDVFTDGPPGTFRKADVIIDPFTRSVDISEVPVDKDFLLTIEWGVSVFSNTAHGHAYVDFVDPAGFGAFSFDDTGLTAKPYRADFDTVATVPLPAGFWLLGSVLVLTGFTGQRRKKPVLSV